MSCSSINLSPLNLSALEKSILETLAYHESQCNLPATAVELHRYLLKKDGKTNPRLVETLKSLEKLTKQALLVKEKGFFCLSPQFFSKGAQKANGLPPWQERILRQKISLKKWKKLKKIGSFLKIIPFIKGVIASGSLCFNNAQSESDLDLLVISNKGRIWTCRLLLSFFLELLGQRRSARSVKDKICLNHYLAAPWFEIETKNLLTAQFYAHLIPLINYQVYESFHKKNHWIKKFFYYLRPERQLHQKRINEKKILFRLSCVVGSFFELILRGKLGNWLERKASAWQIKRIKEKTATKNLSAEKIYFSDKALVFHNPICRYAQVKKTFSEKIKSLNFG